MTDATKPTEATTHLCGIIPPHILQSIARQGDGETASAAERTLAASRRVTGAREVRSARANRPGFPGSTTGLVPPHLQRRMQEQQQGESRTSENATTASDAEASPQRTIYDAEHKTTLPGTKVREEGAVATGDEAVDEAYDGLGDTWELYWEAFQRNSLDGNGLPLIASVHYDENFDNAYWDGEQMVFGDGDGEYFNSFTSSVDVMGHELTHGVTQYTAGFTYVGQSGALNESVSDCFGSMVKQRSLSQSAEEADWLIGEGLFTDKVKGVALRSMKAPGTAYDDPHLGKDPQPATMDGYQDLPHDEDNDNGGVHINSGIPNHAFYLAAVGIGGNSWEGVGPIWYRTITQGGLAKDADFAAFAAATIAAAEAINGEGSSQADEVRKAWTAVGVSVDGTSSTKS